MSRAARPKLLGARVLFLDQAWSVWSEAPGQSCYWLSRHENGTAVFVKARHYQGEWREVRDDNGKD